MWLHSQRFPRRNLRQQHGGDLWRATRPTAGGVHENDSSTGLARLRTHETASPNRKETHAVPTIQQLVRKGRQDKVSKNKTPALKG